MSHPKVKNIHTLPALVAAGLINEAQREALEPVAARYKIAISQTLQSLIDPHNPDDPIRKQFVPTLYELLQSPLERVDPIGDDIYSPVKGIVHRYPDRVLLKPLLTCPVYCRFCFRREFVGDQYGLLSETELQAGLDYISQHSEIREVILTGGDPLMLGVKKLKSLLQSLANIPHLDIIRIHSRVPVADPRLITPDLVDLLAQAPVTLWLSIHVNHAQELGSEARLGINALAKAGIPLLAQTVLLKGINDDPLTLETLFRALIKLRVKPYYLHHPDLAVGTEHFRLTIEEGQTIVSALRGRLSGIAQPLYVLDIPGGAGKVPLHPAYYDREQKEITDWQGLAHPYPPLEGI